VTIASEQDLKLNSRQVTEGPSRAAARASSQSTVTPSPRCNATLRLKVSTLSGVESKNR